MDYRKLFSGENEACQERYDLVMERISRLDGEDAVREPYKDYFVQTGAFIQEMARLYDMAENGVMDGWTIEELAAFNRSLYADILEENYGSSYANPSYAVSRLGADLGQLLSFVYTEMRAMIVYAYEGRKTDMTVAAELFMEIYSCFEADAVPEYRTLKKAIYWYISDYSDVTMEYFLREQVDDDLSFMKDIICDGNLDDLRYLYRYGEYIGQNELKLASYMNTLPDQAIEAMADTFVDGFVRGFKVMRMDLTQKDNVCIRAHIGFERVLRASIRKFEAMGLSVHLFRNPSAGINKKTTRFGFIGTSPNPQYDYDHRQDNALYVDKALNERRLAVWRVIYEKYKQPLLGYAGPAVLEVFGQEPFVPVVKEERLQLSEKQQKLLIDYDSQCALLANRYMDKNNISFTIIAYPLPEIGSDFEAVFNETVRINTLDNELYTRIQQTIINTLDQAEFVHVRGARDKNATDIMVHLHTLTDKTAQSNFENCVADVNIPAGEVFTSPVLKGTNGIINVSSVYLDGYNFTNLSIVFEDGLVKEYTCDNFGEPAENRRYIKENILKNHDTLPIGEFAIGTNTTAYVMANKYNIVHRLPILIVEKMGPHFAVGDTCYSRAEDHKVYNPDGKEIIARENEVSALRTEAPEQAYFNCHTDITIPYDEIGEIAAVLPDGRRIDIIRDGRFVLPGTESLNEPFDL